jgi:formate hydrogenlyase transcriptional activator
MSDPHHSSDVISALDSSGDTAPVNRIEFEELLSDVSARLIAVDPEHVSQTIQSAIDQVRTFFRADRSGLLAVSDNHEIMHVAYASYSDGTRQVSGDINLSQLYPWCHRRVVVDREVLCISRRDELPAEAKVDRSSFEAMGTKSLLVLPISVAHSRLHLILISTVREQRNWPEQYVPRLRLLGEMLINTIERTQALDRLQHQREKLHSENDYLRQEVRQKLGKQTIIGRGHAIRHTLAMAEQVASTDSTVLLLGETGSGKGRLASYIHECSPRRDRTMITVNCSAIPASLLESELFGREKGAYTGALAKQIGRFELAHGSTLFIDEIGELPIEMQVKLLRVLESRTIERLGNPRPIAVDVRIIAATNRELGAAIQEGRFRKDLYYRLNVFPITIPPLRDRREDIPLFVQAFIDEFAGTMAKPMEEVDPESLEALLAYPWPGNVRELRNVVERAMIMSTSSILRIATPEVEVRVPAQSDLHSVERTHILNILNETGWRIRGPHGAAARLGLKPTTLESRIKNLGLIRPGTQA